MGLDARKYHLIQELFDIKKESIIDALERVLKREKEAHQEMSKAHKKELDNRIENYKNNPSDLVDWEDVKRDW